MIRIGTRIGRIALVAVLATFACASGVHADTTPRPLPPSPLQLHTSGQPQIAARALIAEVVVTPHDMWSFGTSGNHAPFAEHGNGSSWTSLPLPRPPHDFDPSLVGATATSPHDVWVVGDSSLGQGSATFAEHWDGHRWTLVPMADLGSVTGFLFAVSADSADDAWAAGVIVGDSHRALIEHWDGRAWHRVAVTDVRATVRGVVAISPDDAWAVGDTEGAYGGVAILHWDGTTWSRVHSPLEARRSLAQLAAVASSSPQDVWAVGSASGGLATLAMLWDGTAWTRAPTPNGVPGSPSLHRLLSVSVLPDGQAWAVGDQQRLSQKARPLAESWNGTRWRIVPVADPGGGASLLAVDGVSATSLWGAGVVTGERKPATLIESWNGHAWVLSGNA